MVPTAPPTVRARGISRFWQIVCGLLLAFVILAYLLPQPNRGAEGTPAARIYAGIALALCAIPMGVAWAICFREQVEQLRPSLFSLLVLVAMQAALVWYAVTMNPGSFAAR